MPSSRPAGMPVAITHALRTPIGRFMGSLAELSAADLGVSVTRDLLQRAGIGAHEVGELIFGNARQAGGGPNVARQISVRAGIGVETPAWTVNMACGSGLKAIGLAVDSIRCGRTEIAVAGGTESMSRLPFMLPGMRKGYRLGHAPVVDGMYQDGFGCPLSDMLMGETADKLARELSIPRAAQDAYALESQRRCQVAQDEGRFDAEISPVTVETRKSTQLVTGDEHPRRDSRIEDIEKLKPVFDAEHGTVTAGNASGITDGAAALLLMSLDRAEAFGLTPLAFVGAASEAGVEPDVMGIGPVPAVRRLSEINGRTPADYDLIELNEAFAAQVLACDRELDLPADRLNVNGGAIALGHPIGATGARIVVSLLHEMQRRGVDHGLATLCISGGLGLASAFQRSAP